MDLSEQAQTPAGYQQEQEEQLISASERALIDHAITISLEQSQKKCNHSCNGLKLKHRKMLVNLKLSKTSQKCTVCYDNFVQGEVIKRLPCGHIFHRDCAKAWLKLNKTCPICRMNLEDFFIKLEKQGKTEYPTKRDNKVKVCENNGLKNGQKIGQKIGQQNKLQL